jgi:hypothetical protein
MARFLRFAAGVAISVAYAVLALVVASFVGSAAPDLWAVCFAAVALGWVAIIGVAFRKEQPWVGYGIIAAPFVILLLVTVGCFVAIGLSSAGPG